MHLDLYSFMCAIFCQYVVDNWLEVHAILLLQQFTTQACCNASHLFITPLLRAELAGNPHRIAKSICKVCPIN